MAFTGVNFQVIKQAHTASEFRRVIKIEIKTTA